MTSPTLFPGPESLAAGATVTELEALAERILDALALGRSSQAVHDAVSDAFGARALLPRDSTGAVLCRALEALGTRVRAVLPPNASRDVTRRTLKTAMEQVGPSAPVVLEDVDGRLWLVTDRTGAKLELTSATGSRNVAVADMVADACARAWFLDAALGLESTGKRHQSEGTERGHHDHPTPQARLRRWMMLERRELGAIVVYALFVGLFSLTLPVAAQALVNTVALGTLLQPLVVLSMLLLGALIFSATLRGAQTYLVEILQRRIFVRVVADLSHRLPRMAREATDRTDAQELLNRFFDTFTVQKSAATLLLGGLEITLTVAVGMLVLAFYHPVLFAFDVVLVLAIAFIVIVLGRRGTPTAVGESKAKYATAAWLEEVARHDSLFKLGGGVVYAELRTETLARQYLQRREEHFGIVFGQTVAVLALQAVANAAVLGIGGFLVIDRQLSLGQLVAAELIVAIVVASLAKIGKYLETYYDLLAAVDKLGHLTDLGTERAGGLAFAPAGNSPAALVIDGVAASYVGGPPVLTGASMTVAAGQRVALSGPTGSGKSLLVELIAALRAPTRGRVIVDGLDVRDLDLTALRRRIAVVRSEVISGSILDNVRLGRPEVDVTAVRTSLSLVGLLSDVESLDDGLRTELTGTGEPLSASQKTRLAVARAIVGSPAVLVLDEALDGLDPRVREPMLDALFDAAQPWTLIITSNAPSIHARCDAVFTLSDGSITQTVLDRAEHGERR